MSAPFDWTCECGQRLDMGEDFEVDAREGRLSVSAACRDCGSTFVVAADLEPADLLRSEGRLVDSDLSDAGRRAKAENAAPCKREDAA